MAFGVAMQDQDEIDLRTARVIATLAASKTVLFVE
jgi:hypothetical protein